MSVKHRKPDPARYRGVRYETGFYVWVRGDWLFVVSPAPLTVQPRLV